MLILGYTGFKLLFVIVDDIWWWHLLSLVSSYSPPHLGFNSNLPLKVFAHKWKKLAKLGDAMLYIQSETIND